MILIINKTIIHQALQTFQCGPSLALLSTSNRTAVDKILQHFVHKAKDNVDVCPAAVLLRLAQFFLKPAVSGSSGQIAAMMARESTFPQFSADS